MNDAAESVVVMDPQPETNVINIAVANTVDAPSDWSMNTPQGNQAMRRKGESLVRNLQKSKDKGDSLSSYVHSFEKYLQSYVRSFETRTCGEGQDKKVKAKVKAFVKKAAKTFKVDESTVETLWTQIVP